ncbi:unnamed protein product, partial [Polarella glacialis]
EIRLRVIKIILGDDYVFYQLFVEPSDAGHGGIGRKRTYVFCLHRANGVYLHDVFDMYAEITHEIQKVVSTKPGNYMVATAEHIALDALATAVSRKIPYQHGQSDLSYLLNEREVTNMRLFDQEYIKRYNRLPHYDDDLFYFLGDNFQYTKSWSAVSGKIPTYRRNTGKYIHRASMRWLTSMDKLASLGFPVTSSTATSMGVKQLPVLDVQRAHVMSGNSMHFSNSAIVLLVGLTCFGRAV